jgi:hypothetical protein
VLFAQELVQELTNLKAKCAQLESNRGGAAATLNPEQAVQKALLVAAKQIKAQMKWKSSCKSDSAKWAYDAIMPEDVYRHMMKIPEGKPAKGCKLGVEAFQSLVGKISVSIRYGALSLTGANINVRYSDGELKFSGSYGLGGGGRW